VKIRRLRGIRKGFERERCHLLIFLWRGDDEHLLLQCAKTKKKQKKSEETEFIVNG
jgi:hypothetical protein